MAKEEYDLEDDDFNWDELDNFGDDGIDGDFTDGSENDGKTRKPVNAIRNALKEGFGETVSPSRALERAKKILPDGYTVAADSLNEYTSEFSQLYQESRQELEKNVNILRREGGRLVKAYDKQLPGFLKNILNKVVNLEEEAEKERQKTEDEKQFELMTEELNAINHAQLEMQKVAESRELLRDQVEGKRFESQQELLFGIKSGVQRINEQNEKVAYRQRNKLLEINYLQLFAQRTIQRTLIQSAEHQKAALDSIVKNTALPEFVKQYKSEMMKEMALRGMMGKATEKLADYMNGFKDNLIKNAKGYIDDKLSMVSGAVDGATMMTDGVIMMKEMEDEFGGSKSLVEKGSGWIGGQLGNYLFDNVIKRGLKTIGGNKIGAAAEWLERTARNLPTIANKWKEDNADSESSIKSLIAEILPGSSLKELSHDADSFKRLNETALFDNATRKSIVDIIPSYLAKILQSTDAIRKKVASNIPINDDDLLEWDHDTGELVRRKTLDDKFVKRIEATAGHDELRNDAIKLVNLIDINNKLPDNLKRKLAKEFILSLGKRQGFNPTEFLGRKVGDWKVKINEAEKTMIEDVIAERFPVNKDIDKSLDYDYQRDLTLMSRQWESMEHSQGDVADVLHQRSRMSSTEAARHRRLNYATIVNGEYTTKGKDIHQNEAMIDKAMARAEKDPDLMKLSVNRDNGYIPDTPYDFQRVKGWKKDKDGNGYGTVPNPRKNEFKPNGKKKDRLTYEEWYIYQHQYYHQDMQLKAVGGFFPSLFNFINGNVLSPAKKIIGEERVDSFTDKVTSVRDRGINAAKDISSIVGITGVAKKVGKNLSEVGNEISSTVKDTVYNGIFDYIKEENDPFDPEKKTKIISVDRDRLYQNLKRQGGKDLLSVVRLADSGGTDEEIIELTKSLMRNSVGTQKGKERLEGYKEAAINKANEITEKVKEKYGSLEEKATGFVKKAKKYYEENKDLSVKELASKIKSDLGSELKKLKDSEAKVKFLEYVSISEEFIKNDEVRKYVFKQLKNIATEKSKELLTKLDEEYKITDKAKQVDERLGITENYNKIKTEIVENEYVKAANNFVSENYEKYIKDKNVNEVVDGILDQMGVSKENRDAVNEHLTKIQNKVHKQKKKVSKQFKNAKKKTKREYRKRRNEAEKKLNALRNSDAYKNATDNAKELMEAAIRGDGNKIAEIYEKVMGKNKASDEESNIELTSNNPFKINSLRLMTEDEMNRRLFDNKLRNSKLGGTPEGVIEAVERNVTTEENEDVKDIFIAGEENPVITAKELREGKYYSVVSGKEIRSVEDIDGPVVDSDGNHIITEDHIQIGLVDKEQKPLIDEAKKLTISGKLKNLRRAVKKGSWGMTKFVAKTFLRTISKPFRLTMNTTDVYLPPTHEGESPRLIMSRWGMMARWYKNEDGEIIDDIRKLKGNVYNRFGDIIATEEELKHAVDKHGKPLSKSYLIRRTRTALRGLKMLGKPLKWAVKGGLLGAKVAAKTAGFVIDGVTDNSLTKTKNKVKAFGEKLKFWKKGQGETTETIESDGESNFFVRRTRIAANGIAGMASAIDKITGMKSLRKSLKRRFNKRKDKILDKITPDFIKQFGFGKRKGVTTENGIAIDERTGKARDGNYKAEFKADDEETKRRDKEAKKRQEKELAGRQRKDKGNSIIAFLQKWFPMIFGASGLLAGIFKGGIFSGISKLTGFLKEGGGWLMTKIFTLPGKIAAALSALLAGKGTVDAVEDAIDDVDIDKDDKNKKDPKQKESKPKNKPKTAKNGRGGIRKRIPRISPSVPKPSPITGATSAASKQVAKSATTTAVRTTGSTVASAVGKQVLKKELGRVVLAALGPIGAVLGAAWLAWDLGTFLWDWFKEPNKVDKFRLAAYGINPESKERSSTVLKLEKWYIENSKFSKGHLALPDITNDKFVNDSDVKDIFRGFVGGDEGREVYEGISDDEKITYGKRLNKWIHDRFIPVFKQHAVSLHQVDPKTNLADAFGAFGGLKDGLVLPWARRAIFKEDDEVQPYNIDLDPFYHIAGESDDEARIMDREDVLRYYKVIEESYTKDEIALRKKDKNEQNKATLKGEKYLSEFAFEDYTKRYTQKSITKTDKDEDKILSKTNYNNGLGVTKLNGSKANVTKKGLDYYLEEDDIKNINLDGRSIISDGIAIRMRCYGLNRFVESHVSTLLKIEKYLESKLKFETDKVILSDLDTDDLLKQYGVLLGWENTDEDRGIFKIWAKTRLIPAFLALANYTYKLTKRKDIINALDNNLIKSYQLVAIYIEVSLAKTSGELKVPIWSVHIGPIKGEKANRDSASIASNLQNLRDNENEKILTEKPSTNIVNKPKAATPTGYAALKEGKKNEDSPLSDAVNAFNASLSTSNNTGTNSYSGNYGNTVIGTKMPIASYTTNIQSSTGSQSNIDLNNLNLNMKYTPPTDGEPDWQSMLHPKGGTIKEYKASKKNEKRILLAKLIVDEMNKLPWSDTEKNHFMAQTTHETGGFQWTSELDSGKAYEGMKDLGNTQPGDGVKYKGRGIIGTTGRVNYMDLAKMLGRPDIMDNPDIVANDPLLAVKAGILWWEKKKKTSPSFKQAVSTDDVVTVSRRVNGGIIGLNDRINLYRTYRAGGGVIREMAGLPMTKVPELGKNNLPASPVLPNAKVNISQGYNPLETAANNGTYHQQTINTQAAINGSTSTLPVTSSVPPTSLPPDLNEGKIVGNTPYQQLSDNTTNTSTETSSGGGTETFDVGANTEVTIGKPKTLQVPGNPMHKVTITKAGMTLMQKVTPELIELGKRFVKFTGGGLDNKGMVPEFMQLFFACVGDFVKSTNEKSIFNVTSAFRSHEKQKRLYYENLRKKGRDDGYVAKPGGSRHEYGIALDIFNTGRKNNGKTKPDFEVGLLSRWEKWGSKSKWGFYRRLRPGATKTWEDWHVENVHFLANGKAAAGQKADGLDVRGGQPTDQGYNPLETAANNGTYHQQTIGIPTTSIPSNVQTNVQNTSSTSSGYTALRGGNTSVMPTTAPTGYNDATQQIDLIDAFKSGEGFKGVANRLSENLTGEKLFVDTNNQSTVDPMTKFMTKQNKSVEVQQKKLLAEQRTQSNEMTSILNEQLSIQKNIDSTVSRLLSFLQEGGLDKTNTSGTSNVKEKKSHISPINKVVTTPKEVVNMRVGGNSIIKAK